MTPTERTLSARGLEFGLLEWGEGPLVLMVHGFPDTAWTWDKAGPVLAAAGYHVVAPFTRGIHPTTIPTDRDYAYDTQGADVLGLIEALDEGPAIVVGHDWGALATYAAAGLQTGQMRAMATLAIPHPAVIKPGLRKLWGVRHFLTNRLPGAADRFAANDVQGVRTLYERWSPAHQWPEEELAPTKEAYTQPGCLQAALDYYTAITPILPASLRTKVDLPALLLGGLSDPMAAEGDFAASIRRFTGPVEVDRLPGGHFLHREHPEPFHERLLPWLAGLS